MTAVSLAGERHHVVSLSGGASSFAAARRTIGIVGHDRTTLLFADVLIEDEDLYRFLDDIEAFLDHPIVRIADGRNPWEVFRDVRFIGNTRADPCSRVLKRELLRSWVDEHHPEGAAVVVGIDWTETHRMDAIRERHAPWHTVSFPLVEGGADRCTVLDELDAAGIRRPRLYDMGFPHNNCGGFCVRGGQAQFARLLHHFPDRYRWHEAQEQAMRDLLDKDVAILRDRRGGETRPLTMREFRGRIERGEAFDVHDWGGCGCAIDDSASQLTLDLSG